MRIKSRGFSILFKLAIVVFGCTGLQLSLRLFTPEPNWDAFKYFTNLSNLLTVVYFLLAAMRLIFRPKCSPTFMPLLKGICIMNLTVTLLVSRFMLEQSSSIRLLLLHNVVPIMTIADWLLCDEKGLMRAYSPIHWTVLPALYLTVVFTGVEMGYTFGYNGALYPYPFINIKVLGPLTVAKTLGMLLVFFISLGYVYVLLDHVLYKLGKGKKKRR